LLPRGVATLLRRTVATAFRWLHTRYHLQRCMRFPSGWFVLATRLGSLHCCTPFMPHVVAVATFVPHTALVVHVTLRFAVLPRLHTRLRTDHTTPGGADLDQLSYMVCRPCILHFATLTVRHRCARVCARLYAAFTIVLRLPFAHWLPFYRAFTHCATFTFGGVGSRSPRCCNIAPPLQLRYGLPFVTIPVAL